MRLSLPGGDLSVQVNIDATAQCYARMRVPGPEACGCAHCANWIAARSSIITAEVEAFLTAFGIPRTGEIEVWQTPGVQKANYYGGWYLFVGEPSGGDIAQSFRVGELEFSVHQVSNQGFLPAEFAGQSCCELQFSIELDDYLTVAEFEAVTRQMAERVLALHPEGEPSRRERGRRRLLAAFRKGAS